MLDGRVPTTITTRFANTQCVYKGETDVHDDTLHEYTDDTGVLTYQCSITHRSRTCCTRSIYRLFKKNTYTLLALVYNIQAVLEHRWRVVYACYVGTYILTVEGGGIQLHARISCHIVFHHLYIIKKNFLRFLGAGYPPCFKNRIKSETLWCRNLERFFFPLAWFWRMFFIKRPNAFSTSSILMRLELYIFYIEQDNVF